MFTIKHQLEMLFIISLGTALSLFVLVQRNNKVDQRVFSAVIPTLTSTTSTDISSYLIQTVTIDSPDGVKTLTMKKQQVKDLTKYSFYTLAPDTGKQIILSKDLKNTQNLSIPYNTWSPDNKYVFLKESTPILNNYYVFSSSGNPVSDNAQYTNIQELFSQKLADYRITDVTGWAGPTLLIVNAIANKGGQNISFWFDMSNQSFIQLGTYFN